MGNFEIDKLEEMLLFPISGEMAAKLLKNADVREDFLLNYLYFHNDGNSKVYSEWIFGNLPSKSNIIIEHVFKLANYCNVSSSLFLGKIDHVLRNRFWQFTKLACLDFLISQYDSINKSKYESLSKLGFIHTKDELVKFQSCINLTLCQTSRINFIKEIKLILKRTQYPTLFYRLINQFDLLPQDRREQLAELMLIEIKFKEFDIDVIEEIGGRIPKIT